MKKSSGFGIFEIIIIITVMGLIAVGISSLAAMKRQSIASSVIQEIAQREKMHEMFITLYDCIAGDCNKPISGGTLGASGLTTDRPYTNKRYLMGNGNGMIGWDGTTYNVNRTAYREVLEAENHFYIAGLSNKIVNFINSTDVITRYTQATNFPASKLGNGAVISHAGSLTGTTSWNTNVPGNNIYIGQVACIASCLSKNLFYSSGYVPLGIIKNSIPIIQIIDKKTDDGAVNTGAVRASTHATYKITGSYTASTMSADTFPYANYTTDKHGVLIKMLR
jgi:hypothetical protein